MNPSQHLFRHPVLSLCLINKLQKCFCRLHKLTLPLSTMHAYLVQAKSPLQRQLASTPRETNSSRIYIRVYIRLYDSMYVSTYKQYLYHKVLCPCKQGKHEKYKAEPITSFGALDFVKTSLICCYFPLSWMQVWNGKRDVSKYAANHQNNLGQWTGFLIWQLLLYLLGPAVSKLSYQLNT